MTMREAVENFKQKSANPSENYRVESFVAIMDRVLGTKQVFEYADVLPIWRLNFSETLTLQELESLFERFVTKLITLRKLCPVQGAFTTLYKQLN